MDVLSFYSLFDRPLTRDFSFHYFTPGIVTLKQHLKSEYFLQIMATAAWTVETSQTRINPHPPLGPQQEIKERKREREKSVANKTQKRAKGYSLTNNYPGLGRFCGFSSSPLLHCFLSNLPSTLTPAHSNHGGSFFVAF